MEADVTDSKIVKSEDKSGRRESYSHGYDSKFVDYLEGRTIANDAAFFLPHLKTGANLLDCGCGPGSITIDQGWIDSKKVDELSDEWRSWGKHPGAFPALLCCEAVGWKR